MNEENNQNGEIRKGGIKSRSQLYAMFVPHAEEAVKTLVEALHKGNPAVRVGAAKTILAKLVPDIKATELSGPDGQQFTINLIRDYLTKDRGDVLTPNNGSQGSIEVQGPNMAPESEKDINITREDGTGVP